MKALRKLWHQWVGGASLPDPRQRSSVQNPAESEIYMKRRNDALDTLEIHGLQAHYYLPATRITDNTLADACRFLGNSGYIITDRQGSFVGKIATARPLKGGWVAPRRASFQIAKSE